MTIKQTTANDVLTVLKWVVENPHHISSACDAKHPDCMVLKGHHAKLIIKPETMKGAYDHITYSHNVRRFDTRMYLPNDQGISLLSTMEDCRMEEIIEKYALMSDLENFTKSYLIAALWSSNDEGGTPLDTNYDIKNISEDTLATMKKDCELFLILGRNYIFADGCPNANDGTGQAGMAGHDFWLTRNGHGVGFWDGDWPESSASKLTKLSRDFGIFSLYVENGKIGNA